MAVIGGGAGQSILEEHLFIESCTFSPWANCTALVTVVGGGGSGGRGGYISAGYYNGMCTGGGAGAAAKSKLTLSKDVTYTITAGAGGAQLSASTAVAAGSAGGNSAFAGSDITDMAANGGAGGTASNGGAHSNATLTGAAGGAAGSTGNLWNTAGGSAGNISVTFSSPSSHYANSYSTGGGSVGLFGANGFTSGAITHSGSSVWQNRYCATGGAGLGAGTGTIDPGNGSKTGQGGAGLRGATTANDNNLGMTGLIDNLMGSPQLSTNYGFGAADFPSAPVSMSGILAGSFAGFGVSGVGVGGQSIEHDTNNASAGFFAGGGVQIGVYGRTRDGGAAFLGGGGGPYAAYTSTTANQNGKGGDGFIVIQILNWSI